MNRTRGNKKDAEQKKINTFHLSTHIRLERCVETPRTETKKSIRSLSVVHRRRRRRVCVETHYLWSRGSLPFLFFYFVPILRCPVYHFRQLGKMSINLRRTNILPFAPSLTRPDHVDTHGAVGDDGPSDKYYDGDRRRVTRPAAGKCRWHQCWTDGRSNQYLGFVVLIRRAVFVGKQNDWTGRMFHWLVLVVG